MLPLKIKTVANRVLPIKEIVLVLHVTLVKPNVIQKLDGINIIVQLKVQNHYNTFEATSTTILHEWTAISNAPKNAKTSKNLETSYIALWKLDLNEEKDFERLDLFRNGVA